MGRPAVASSKFIKLHLSRIELDKTYWPRQMDDTAFQRRVSTFVLNMETGVRFPPVVVVHKSGTDYILIDGWHRIQAYSNLQHFEIECELLTLPPKQWLAEAVRRNIGHGLPLSFRDKVSLIPRLQEQEFSIDQIAKLFHLTVKALNAISVDRVTTETGMEDEPLPRRGDIDRKTINQFERSSIEWSRFALKLMDEIDDLEGAMKDWVGKTFDRAKLLKVMGVCHKTMKILEHKYRRPEALTAEDDVSSDAESQEALQRADARDRQLTGMKDAGVLDD